MNIKMKRRRYQIRLNGMPVSIISVVAEHPSALLAVQLWRANPFIYRTFGPEPLSGPLPEGCIITAEATGPAGTRRTK